MTASPKFQEEYSAKIPALALLNALGWRFLSPAELAEQRGGDEGAVVLEGLLRAFLAKWRFTHGREERALSAKAVDNLVATLMRPDFSASVVKANEGITNHLLFGITAREVINGRTINVTVPLIDWHDVSRNSFTFTEEFSILRTDRAERRRPDIVCFVNGIPLVVIEAKRPDGRHGPTLAEGISQSLRNQRRGEIPQLFAYSQILLSINGQDGRYGTCGTAARFWAAWHEEEIPSATMEGLKNTTPSSAQMDALFAGRKKADRLWFEGWMAGGLALTEQDRLIIGLLSPARLLEMTRFFTLFDRKRGKLIARYQQVFGIRRLLERLRHHDGRGAREGGVVWHTTGSGKSLTMVFLSRALLMDEALKQCRILIVTDRKDLEKQLSGTFSSSGELAGKRDLAGAVATSGRRLAEQIGSGQQRIIFSIINKFNSATTYPQCHNDSADLIVLVDEGHRSQGGETHTRMRHALPNAAFIAFTGTPLLKGSETTNRFGKLVHSYTMQQAVADGTVTPLLYEERRPDLEINDRAIDAWLERITQGLEEEQVRDLKKHFARTQSLYKADDRIRLIAADIALHFENNMDEGLKGMVACDSKLSAIRYKQYLDEFSNFETAIVMSAPDTREGHEDIDESHQPEVQRWWAETVGSQDEEDYTNNVIKRFESDPELKLLIVVDKLLTGFDEPQNAVLYIDKPLKQHNLLQAIARVNRLHEGKKYGYLIDYRGILAELDTTLQRYDELAAQNVGGYDPEDIKGLYQQMSSEYRRLPALYARLWKILGDVRNRQDIQQLRAVLMPRMEDGHDVNQKRRDDFYEALTEFASCLKVALQSIAFFEDTGFTEADRRNYKETLKQLTALRRIVAQDAGEVVDFGQYARDVEKLLDRHVAGVQVQESGDVYAIGRMGQQDDGGEEDDPDKWSDEKTRNETDLIRTRLTKTIEHDMQDDPYAREKFSALLRELIKETEKRFDHPGKAYMLFRDLEEQVAARKLDDMPAAFEGHRNAQACYGVLCQQLEGVFRHKLTGEEERYWVDLAFFIDETVTKAVQENSLSRSDREKAVKKALLPRLFEAVKLHGGMERTQAILEQVIQIMRAGPARDLAE